jgi:hypothetical protein
VAQAVVMEASTRVAREYLVKANAVVPARLWAMPLVVAVVEAV